MRKLFPLMLASLALASAMTAGLTAGSAQPLSPAPPTADDGVIEQGPADIRKVTVAILDQLSIPQRIAVNQQIAQTAPDELRQLRQRIESTPSFEAALEDYGSAPSSVIAVAYDDTGEVTLVIAS